MARVFDASTGTRPTAWALTRSGATATYINSSNVLTTAAANAERLDYDNSGVLQGLLYEPSQSNLIIQSATFTNAAWLTINGAAKVGVASAVVGPDGTTGHAYEISFGATGGAIGSASAVYQQSITMSTSTIYTGYFWVRAKTGSTTIRVSITDQASVTTGTADTTVTTTWQRVWLSVTTSSTGSAGGNLAIRNNVAGNSANVYIWAADISQTATAYPASYVLTTTASASHSADSASFTLGSNVTSLTFTFDDSSTQLVTGLTPGATYTIPTTLNRPWILYIDDNVSALSVGTNTITQGTAGAFTAPTNGTVTLAATGTGASGGKSSGGGGGGAYAGSNAISVSAGDVLYFNVPTGPAGTTTSTGGAGIVCWINKATNAAPTSNTTGVKAAGGSAPVAGTGGAGGTTGNSIGNTLHAGGTGASTTTGGGGGGAGPSGDGGAASGTTGGAGGSGGGGAGGNGSSFTPGAGNAPGGGAGSFTTGTTGAAGGNAAGSVVYSTPQTYNDTLTFSATNAVAPATISTMPVAASPSDLGTAFSAIPGTVFGGMSISLGETSGFTTLGTTTARATASFGPSTAIAATTPAFIIGGTVSFNETTALSSTTPGANFVINTPITTTTALSPTGLGALVASATINETNVLATLGLADFQSAGSLSFATGLASFGGQSQAGDISLAGTFGIAADSVLTANAASTIAVGMAVAAAGSLSFVQSASLAVATAIAGTGSISSTSVSTLALTAAIIAASAQSMQSAAALGETTTISSSGNFVATAAASLAQTLGESFSGGATTYDQALSFAVQTVLGLSPQTNITASETLNATAAILLASSDVMQAAISLAEAAQIATDSVLLGQAGVSIGTSQQVLASGALNLTGTISLGAAPAISNSVTALASASVAFAAAVAETIGPQLSANAAASINTSPQEAAVGTLNLTGSASLPASAQEAVLAQSVMTEHAGVSAAHIIIGTTPGSQLGVQFAFSAVFDAKVGDILTHDEAVSIATQFATLAILVDARTVRELIEIGGVREYEINLGPGVMQLTIQLSGVIAAN